MDLRPPESITGLPRHFPGLDGLRALAILLVIPHNLNLFTGTPTGLAAHAIGSYLDRGWIGVQLFFVLSGFLITGILLDGRPQPDYFRRFYVRRVLRIFPLYYAVLVTVLVVLPFFHALPDSLPRFRGDELSYWFFYTNWYGPFHEGEGSMPHLWSLAVEEQFYLLWPLLVFGRSTPRVAWLCLAITVAGLAVRVFMVLIGAPTEAIYSFLISRMDGLALGGLIAAMLRIPATSAWLSQCRSRCAIAGAIVLLIGAAISRAYTFSSHWTLTLGYSMLGVSFALFIASIACADVLRDSSGIGRILRWSGLQRIGKHSYAMYLLHVPIHAVVGLPLLAILWPASPRTVALNISYIVLCTTLTFVAALATYWLIEAPFLRLRPVAGPQPAASAD